MLLLDLKRDGGQSQIEPQRLTSSSPSAPVRLQYTLDLRRQKKLSKRNQAAKNAELTSTPPTERHAESFLDFLNEHSPGILLPRGPSRAFEQSF